MARLILGTQNAEIPDRDAKRRLRSGDAVLVSSRPFTIRMKSGQERVRTTYCSPDDENFRDEIHRQHDIPRIGRSRKLDPEFLRYKRERAAEFRRQSLNNKADHELAARNAARNNRMNAR